MRTLISFLFLFIATPIWAAQITLIGSSGELVAASHDKGGWALNEHACLEAPSDWDPEKTYVPSCGWVIMATHRGAIVKFADAPDYLYKGRSIVRNSSPPSEPVMKGEAARREAELRHWEELIPIYQLLLGGSSSGFDSTYSPSSEIETFSFSANKKVVVGLGFNFFRTRGVSAANLNPKMGLQILPSLLTAKLALEATDAVGLSVLYSKYTDGDISGSELGALLTYDYFPAKVFHGWWLQLGAGISSTTNTTTSAELSYLGFRGVGTLGYRGGGTVNWGVAAGAQGIFAPRVSGTQGYMFILPCLQADVSWNF